MYVKITLAHLTNKHEKCNKEVRIFITVDIITTNNCNCLFRYTKVIRYPYDSDAIDNLPNSDRLFYNRS